MNVKELGFIKKIYFIFIQILNVLFAKQIAIGITIPMGSTSGSIAKPNSKFKTNPNSPLWKYVEMIRQILGGGGYVWKCSGCEVTYSSSYHRVKAHLCGIGGKGITTFPRKEGEPIPLDTVAKYIMEQDATNQREAQKGNNLLLKNKSKGMQPPSNPNIVVEYHPFMATLDPQAQSAQPITNKRNKGPLEVAFQNESRALADQCLARCIYANGLAFNVVRSPYWKEMLRTVNEAPKGYKGLGYEKVRGSLLEKEVELVEGALKPIRDSWVETGVSIVSDGWKDSRNQPLINVIAVSPKGAMVLKAVDCEGQVKDGQFIANILIAAIEQVGSRNVVQVVMDNAKNCRAKGCWLRNDIHISFGHLVRSIHSILCCKRLGIKLHGSNNCMLRLRTFKCSSPTTTCLKGSLDHFQNWSY